MDESSYMAYGRHVLADISGVGAARLDDLDRLESSLVAAARAEGVSVEGVLRKKFHPMGVTVLLLLAESHVSLHTYPERGKAFFDAFTCGVDYDPRNILHRFVRELPAATYTVKHVERGTADSLMLA